MFTTKKILFILSFLISGFVIGHTENSDFEFHIYFKVADATLDSTFADNAENLALIDARLREIASDSTIKISAVSFNGTASPEGDHLLNKQLSIDRAATLESYIRARIDLPADCRISHYTPGVAWSQLYEMVQASDMANKKEVLSIIRNIPEVSFNKQGEMIDSRKKRLMDLRGGRPWDYMYRNFFPDLRIASSEFFTITTTAVNAESVEQPADSTMTVKPWEEPDTLPTTVVVVDNEIDYSEIIVEPVSKPFYMDFKSNMLLDILALPNIGVEFYLGKNITAGLNWTYGWWDCDHRHRYWRAYGGEINARYWFGTAAQEKPLTGHHVGVYASTFIYDFELGGKGQMGGEPGKPIWHNPSYMAGVEYGYSLPVSRHFNIDFSIGFGYLGGKYYEYNPIDDHYVWDKTKRRNWFGPTKAEVSIVWLLGNGNYNAGKGGKK